MVLIARLFYVVLSAAVLLSGSPNRGKEIWSRIESIAEKSHSRNDPEIIEYLRSLSPEEIFAAARQGCDAAEEQVGASEENRLTLAAKNALLCLQSFLDGPDLEPRIKRLLEIVASNEEPVGLRLGIISCFSGPSRRYAIAGKLHDYALSHIDTIEAPLVGLLGQQRSHIELRRQAIISLSSLYRTQLERIAESDLNVMKVKQQTTVVGETSTSNLDIVISGKAVLTEASVEAIRPIEDRIIRNAKLLVALIAHQSEPEELRNTALHRLQSYKQLPLSRGDEIETLVDNLKTQP